MHLAEILLYLDRTFKENLAFQAGLEQLLAIHPLDVTVKPFEPGGSDGLILTVIMQMAEFAAKNL